LGVAGHRLRQGPYHASATAQHRQFRRQKRRYVTTDYVLSETVSGLFGAVPFGMAKHFMANLFQSIRARRHRLEFVTPDQFHRAYDLRLRYHDKPDISFLEFTSMVVMQDLGITEVFTGDDHFRQVNLGFQLVP